MQQEIKESLVRRLVELMEQLSAEMRSRSPVAWPDLEFTMPQVRTLLSLNEGPKRMSDLSTYLATSMPAATKMVDRLIAKGLVERTEDSSDRRVVACRLTAEGHELVDRFWRLGRMRIEALADVLDLKELEVVVPAMVILAEAAGRLERAEPAVRPAEETPVATGG